MKKSRVGTPDPRRSCRLYKNSNATRTVVKYCFFSCHSMSLVGTLPNFACLTLLASKMFAICKFLEKFDWQCVLYMYTYTAIHACILPYMVYTAIHGVYCHTWCILPYTYTYVAIHANVYVHVYVHVHAHHTAIHVHVYSVYDGMCNPKHPINQLTNWSSTTNQSTQLTNWQPNDQMTSCNRKP